MIIFAGGTLLVNSIAVLYQAILIFYPILQLISSYQKESKNSRPKRSRVFES